MTNPTNRPTPGRKVTRRRSAGEGSIYRHDNRWRGAITWTEPDGTRRRRFVSAPTAAEARTKLDALRRKLELGEMNGTGRETVGEYLVAWLPRDRVKVRPSTSRQRETHVRVHLIPTIGRIPLAKLTAADVERVMSKFMAEGRPVNPGASRRGQPVKRLSSQTVRHIRATLRRALNQAIRDGLITRNAAREASPPRLPHHEIVYLSPAMAVRLVARTAECEYGPMYAIAVSTGLRIGEICGLSWGNIDFVAGTLSVRKTMMLDSDRVWRLDDTKSEQSRRTIPLPSVARSALLTQLERQNKAREKAGNLWQNVDELVFTDEIGRRLTPHGVSQQFQRDREAAGVPRVRFHDLRHTAATLLLAQGVPLVVVSKWLGHAGIAITAKNYAAVVPELHVEAASAMDRALPSGMVSDE